MKNAVTALVERIVASGGSGAAQSAVGSAEGTVQLIAQVGAVRLTVAACLPVVAASACGTAQHSRRAGTIELVRVVFTLRATITCPVSEDAHAVKALKLVWSARRGLLVFSYSVGKLEASAAGHLGRGAVELDPHLAASRQEGLGNLAATVNPLTATRCWAHLDPGALTAGALLALFQPTKVQVIKADGDNLVATANDEPAARRVVGIGDWIAWAADLTPRPQRPLPLA